MKTREKNKVQLTLGDLYRRMSADFRAVRPEDHLGCVMPMVVRSGADDGSNWTIQPLTSFCPFCRTLSLMVAQQYADRFDVRFPPERAPTGDALPDPRPAAAF